MPADDVSGTLMNMASGEESPLGNLLKSGDVDKAATMAYAVLSMVDTSEGQMDSEDKKSVSKITFYFPMLLRLSTYDAT